MQKKLLENWKLIIVIAIIVITFGYVGLNQRDQPYGGTTYWNKIFGKKVKLEPLSTQGLPPPATDVPVTLPPDPGEAGKLTLAGIDSNNDGVRDDLEREIVYMYPQNNEVRRVLRAMIKKEQQLITTTGDHDWFEGLELSYLALSNCYDYILRSNVETAHHNGDILYTILINTPLRHQTENKNAQTALPFSSPIYFSSEACTQPLVLGQY